MTVKLNHARLLGFRIVSGSARTQKVGVKVGGKIGNKLGSKSGVKSA